MSAIKSDRDYLIGVELVIETDCLPILGMMRCCTILDVAMLRWIAYVKSLNPEVRHISKKVNAIADMLSRARFGDNITESDNEEVSKNYFTSGHIYQVNVIQEFREAEYVKKSLMIGKVLQEIEESSDNKEKRAEIRSKKRRVRKFFLNNGLIWREPKRPDGIPLRAVRTKEQRNQIISEFYESDWAGHRGTWATFAKIKQKYW